jgi:hypothetical protein
MDAQSSARGAGGTRPRAGGTVAAFVVVAAFVAHALFVSKGAVMDDAYIAFRYADNLARGAGLVFQAGDPPVEGYSCFSWVVLGAALRRVGLDPSVFLPFVGIACGIGVVVVVMGAARRLRGPGPAPALGEALPGALLAASPGLAYYAASGLETALYCLLVVLAATAALEGRPRRAAVAASLAILTRPEGAAVAAIAVGVGLARARPAERRGWLVAGGATLAVALAYAAFKWGTFGALLPNTALAKPPVLGAGLAYVGWGLVDAGPLVLVSVALVVRRRERHARLAWALGAALALALVAVVEGGDWMPAGRLLLPAICVASLALDAIGCALVDPSPRVRRAVAVLAGAGALFYLYWSSVDTRLLANGSADTAHYEPFRDAIVEHMTAAGVGSIGSLDIGRIAHSAPAVRILDLGGLTDPEIARAPGDYRSKRIDPAILERKAPDAFLFASKTPPRERAPGEEPAIDFYYGVERAVAESAWFRERYRLRAALPVRADYTLCWYQRVPVAAR